MKRQNLRTVSLIVVTLTYLLIGAAIFGWLESEHEQRESKYLERFEWDLRQKYNISDHDYTLLTTAIIHSVPHKAGIQWKFAGAFYFATTVVTTIGYGHSTPSTVSGRSFCMVYALIGIPLGLVMFQSIGERLNTFVGSALRHVKRACRARNPEVTQTNLVMVVLVLSTILMSSMAAVFATYESWSYFDSLYYCFITLTTIGFGDYVALQKDSALQDNPKYVALSLIFILFGLSVVSSAVNLLVLKFLTLNTEDERRDEQLRYTAAMNPIQLEGDVITSPAGRVEYARMKRPALTLSQAMAAGSAIMGVTDRQRRAIVSAEMARSRPVLALTHRQLKAGARARTTANTGRRGQLRSGSGSLGSARSTDSSTNNNNNNHQGVGKIHIQDSRRHRAEEDELRQVVGGRKATAMNNCDDELDCDDNDRRLRRRLIDGQRDDDNEILRPFWRTSSNSGRQMNKQWASNDNKYGHEGEQDDDEDDDEDVDDVDDDEDDGESDSSTCYFHNQNKEVKCVHAAHNYCTPCPAHAAFHTAHFHRNNNNNNTPVRYPVCHNDAEPSHHCHTLQCPRQQHIVYVPSSQSSLSQVHAHAHQHYYHHNQRPAYYYHPPLLGSRWQRSPCRACHNNQAIPLELEQAPLSTQLAAIRTTSQRPPAAPDDEDDHAEPVVELVMSAGSLGTPSPLISGSPTGTASDGQVFAYPDQTLRNHGEPEQAVLMNAQRGRPACAINQQVSSLSTLQIEQRRYCRSQQLEARAPSELVRQTRGGGDPRHCGNHGDHRLGPLRRKIAPSRFASPGGLDQSSCSCSWVSLAPVPARHRSSPPPLDNWHTPTCTFHPAAAAATAALASNAKSETSGQPKFEHRRRSQDCISKRTTAVSANDSQKSFVRSSPAVHEIDQRDERRAAQALGQSGPSSTSLRTPPAHQPKSPTSTFDGGRPTGSSSRSARGRMRSPPTSIKSSNHHRFTFIDSKPVDGESPASVSTSSASTVRPRGRSSNETPDQVVPRLVCKCCCQHAECIQYALSSETKTTAKEKPAGTNEIPMQGNNNNNITNTDTDNDAIAAQPDNDPAAPREDDADCNRNCPSELATSASVILPAGAGDDVISDEQTRAEVGDQTGHNISISTQLTGLMTTTSGGRMNKQQDDDDDDDDGTNQKQ